MICIFIRASYSLSKAGFSPRWYPSQCNPLHYIRVRTHPQQYPNLSPPKATSQPPNDSPSVPLTANYIYEHFGIGPSTRSAASVSPWVSLPKKVILGNYVLVAHEGVDVINMKIRLSNRVEDAINGRMLQFHPLTAHRDHVENESASIHSGKHSLVLFCARQPHSNALHRSLKLVVKE